MKKIVIVVLIIVLLISANACRRSKYLVDDYCKLSVECGLEGFESEDECFNHAIDERTNYPKCKAEQDDYYQCVLDADCGERMMLCAMKDSALADCMGTNYRSEFNAWALEKMERINAFIQRLNGE